MVFDSNLKKPKLRFPYFNDDWCKKKIEDCFVFKNGLNKEKEYFGKGTPIINFNDVFHLNGIQEDDIEGLVELTQKEIERFSAQKGDVFFTRTSETIDDIGMAAVLMDDVKDCVFSGFVLRASPITDELDLSFKKYCFSVHSVRKEIVTKSSMTTRALTSGTLLNKVVINFPSSKKEQQKIASFLTAVDTKIQQLSKKKELLEQYKKGVMQKLFSQEIRFTPQLEDLDLPQGAVVDLAANYPDWKEKKLGELFIINAGGDINKKNVSPKKTDKFRYPIYSNSEIKKGLYGFSDLFKVNCNCITVTGRGKLGKAHARFKQFYPIVRLLVLKPMKKVDLIFFEHVINELRIFNESTGVPQLTAPQMASYSVKFPTLIEQEKIGKFFTSIDKKIESVESQLEKTKTFKKGLLQQMFV